VVASLASWRIGACADFQHGRTHAKLGATARSIRFQSLRSLQPWRVIVHQVPRFFNVPTHLLRIDSPFVHLSYWDNSVVHEDLLDYIEFTRAVACTPEVVRQNNAIYVVTGEPFVRASQLVSPPISMLVCSSFEDLTLVSSTINSLSLKDLIDQADRQVQENKNQWLFFGQHLSDSDKHNIEDCIMRTNLGIGFISYRGIRSRTALTFEMAKVSADDVRLRKLLSILTDFCSVYNLSSWNGINFFNGLRYG